ncbi:MAG: hypothetical protein ACR2O3_08885 [Rhizobiaceae bacterium]
MSIVESPEEHPENPSRLELWARSKCLQILKSWAFVGLITLTFAMLGGIWELYDKRTNTPVTYAYGFQLNFDGRSNNKYPNGANFFLSDILESGNLIEVYENNQLSQYNISLRDFVNLISVRPYNTRRFETTREFELLSRNWVNSLSDLQTIKEEMEQQLNSANKNAALVTLVDVNKLLPSDVAKKVVVEVVEKWAVSATRDRGVLNTQIDAISPSIMDPAVLEKSNPLNGLKLILRRASSLSEFLTELQTQPGGRSAVDDVSGLNLESLSQKVEDAKLELLEIPRSWSSDMDKLNADSKLPINIFSPSVFGTELLEGQDFAIALDIVTDRINLIGADVQKLLDTPFGGVVTDPETGKMLFDLNRQLNDMIEIDIEQLKSPVVALGISSNPEFTSVYYTSKIQELIREQESLKEEAAVIRSALDEGEVALGNFVRTPSGVEASNSSNVPLGVTQINEGVVDRLLSLSEKSGNNEFLKQLISRRTSIRLREVQTKSEILRLQQLISNIRVGQNSESDPLSNRKELIKEISDRINSELPNIVSELGEHAKTINRISSRLGFAEKVHSALYKNPDEARYKMEDYLLDSDISKFTLADIVNELREYAEISNRILTKVGINQSNVGKSLYVPLTSAEAIHKRLIDLRMIMFVVMMATIGLMTSVLILVFYPQKPTNNSTKS